MKKLFTFFAAMLVALAVNAQGTDFASPGYSCTADAATLSGGSSGSFYLDQTLDPHQITWSDCGLTSNALATWTVTATRGCYVTVALDLGPVIASNKHIFEVKILDLGGNVRGTLAEPAENADADQVKALTGTILLPVAGEYTVELRNNRDWGKGHIKSVILTYDSDAPTELIAVESVTLNKTTLSLEVDDVELLSATVLPDNAFDPSVTWTSSDPTVAVVNANGFVEAVAPGTTTITAAAGEKSATCALTVTAATVPSTGFDYEFLAKNAHIEGAVWKNEDYKLYGKGDNNKNYGTASWQVNVTRPCIVSGSLQGVEGGHIFGVDVYDADNTLIGSLEQPADGEWWSGIITLTGTVTFPAVGLYTIKLRNTQEWSSGKVESVYLTFEGEYSPAAVKYCELPQGHLLNPDFADVNGRILLTIAKGEGNNIVVKVKNNNANGNTKTGLNYLWVNAEGATGGVVRYGDGTHNEADVEEVSVIVPFDAAKESYNFINIHWAYSGWDGEWAINDLTVQASELCEEGSATSISNTQAVEQSVKFIENGQLFIRKNGVVYNAQGEVVR